MNSDDRLLLSLCYRNVYHFSYAEVQTRGRRYVCWKRSKVSPAPAVDSRGCDRVSRLFQACSEAQDSTGVDRVGLD
jgi:hypothetical protein